MSINMQGRWTVSVKAKNAQFPQRFIISDAASGNGTRDGLTTTAPVLVTGAAWSITIQSNAGKGWVDSEDQVKLPTLASGTISFDIESNDAGQDRDFDDLILTCSAPQSETDFVIYGNVSSYGPTLDDACPFNPCFPFSLVVDTQPALERALQLPAVRDAIGKLYPVRLFPRPPLPDPPPFRPLVIPVIEEAGTQGRKAQVLKVSRPEPKAARGKAKAAAPSAPQVVSLGVVSLDAGPVARTVEYDRVVLAAILDLRPDPCNIRPLPGVAVRFQEYDRTAAELAGGSHSKDGMQENLGVCATDHNGNYVFRFSRSIAQISTEVVVDVAPGEDVVLQALPDLIAQVLDPVRPTDVAFESAPYRNVPMLKRIDLCVPRPLLGGGLNACSDGLIIQSVGRIFIGPVQPSGSREGFNNFLSVTGRITANNSAGPLTRCAAWRGKLDLYACLNNTDIRYYTIRYKRPGESLWKLYQEPYKHQKQANIGRPGYDGDLVGPFDISLSVDGGPKAPTKAYDNIKVLSSWIGTHLLRKAQVRSTAYDVGSVQFRIEGYRENGTKFPGADDVITLYIDNTSPLLLIDENVTLGGQTRGDCALLTVPANSPGAPLTVRFVADQAQGFLDSYSLYMQKGATDFFDLLPLPDLPPAPYRERHYRHGDDLACSQLRGTPDDPTADPLTGLVTVAVSPAAGAWLEPDQTFCAFAIRLGAVTRTTDGLPDGYGGRVGSEATPVLIGLQKA